MCRGTKIYCLSPRAALGTRAVGSDGAPQLRLSPFRLRFTLFGVALRVLGGDLVAAADAAAADAAAADAAAA